MIRLPETGPELGRCGCGAVVRPDGFRDESSPVEWDLSGFCQRCQDQFSLAVDQKGDARVYPLRFGVLAAHRSSGREVLEIGLLPFLCIPALHLLVWEARYTLRIGRVIPPALPTELDPIAQVLAKHRVRVTSIYEFSDPRLGEWFSDLELLITLDCRSMAEIVGACPALGGGLGVPISDAIPWSAMAGPPLTSFGHLVRPGGLDSRRNAESRPPSALRLCARLGAALCVTNRGSSEEARTALWHVLESVKGCLPSPSKP